MFQTKFVERIKSQIFCSVTVFENHAVYEIMWKNGVERGRPQMKIRCLRIACSITKSTNTHSGYVILIVFPRQKWLHERVSFLRYTYEGWNFNSGNYLFTTDTK